MSSSLAKLNEAEIPGLIRHLEKFNAYFSRATISQKSSISNQEEIVEELMTEVSDAYKKAKECVSVAFKIHQLYEKTNQKLQRVSYKNEALKSRNEEMKSQIQDQLNEFIIKEKRIESLSHDLNDIEQGFKDMVNENKQLKRDVLMLKKEISLKEQGTRSRAASQEVKRLPPDLKQEQINALQIELRKQIEDAEGLQFQIKDLENLLKIEKNNSERLKFQNGSIRKELDDANQEIENLQNEKSELQEQLETYKNEIIHQKILIENLQKLHEKDKMRATFVSEAGYSNHAEDEMETPIVSHEQDIKNNDQYSLMSLRQKKMQDWRRTMTIDTENLGEVFESEEVPDEKQFFVLSSPTSKYGQFQSFVDSVRDKAILSDEVLPSIKIEAKMKRKGNEITKIFDIEIKKKEPKLRFVELITEKISNVKVLPYKDYSKLRMDKQADGIFVKKEIIELQIETLANVNLKESKKKLSVEKHQAVLIERKQQEMLLVENIPSFSIEKSISKLLSTEAMHAIKIAGTIKPLLCISSNKSIYIENSYKKENAIEVKANNNHLSIEKLSKICIERKYKVPLIIESLPVVKLQGFLSIENCINKIFIQSENLEINKSRESKAEPVEDLHEKFKTLEITEVLNYSLVDKRKQNLSIEKTPILTIEIYKELSKNIHTIRHQPLEINSQNQIYLLPIKTQKLFLEATSMTKIESKSMTSLKIHQFESILIKSTRNKTVILEAMPASKIEEKEFLTMESQSELKIDPNHLSMETAATAKDNAEIQNKYLLKDQWHTNEVKRDALQIESSSGKTQKPLNDKQIPLNYDNKTKFSQTFASSDHKSELLELDILKSIKSPEANNPSPKKKSKKNYRQNRKIFTQDPIKQFFILTCEAAKINSEKRDFIGQIPFDLLFSKVFEEHIPFNNWHDYVQKFLHSKII
ncbi:unnamed protein product [Blepharisma stoltei]|uniref:Viral A-type inclusion protein n=1 Tax=Blepharisma stoltei TaxID=1481888 RepID=A0AAU9JTY1_9CILI|nr:unnamed protein product [Blepharisma stoltei]